MASPDGKTVKCEFSKEALEELEEELSRDISLAESKEWSHPASPSPVLELEQLLGIGTETTTKCEIASDAAPTEHIEEKNTDMTTTTHSATLHESSVNETSRTPSKSAKESSTGEVDTHSTSNQKKKPNNFENFPTKVKGRVTQSSSSKTIRKVEKPPGVLQFVIGDHEEKLKLKKALQINPFAVTKLLHGYCRAELKHSKSLAKTYKTFSEEMSKMAENLKQVQEINILIQEILDMEGDEEAHELMNRLRFDELGELVDLDELEKKETSSSRLNLGILKAPSGIQHNESVNTK